MSAVPKVLVPMVVGSSNLTACSITEPAPDETAWVSGATYTVGMFRILTSTHRVYKCALGHTGRTNAPNVAGEETYWVDYAPTKRYAAFDELTNTRSIGTTSISFTLLMTDFVSSVALFGVSAATTRVVVREGAGGTLVYDSLDRSMILTGLGFWEYYHSAPTTLDKTVFQDIPLCLNPEITITISGTSGTTVSVGMIAVGDLKPLLDTTSWGGTQYGAQSKPTTYSYIKRDDYGGVTIQRRSSATDMRISVKMPHGDADRALGIMQSVLDVPAAWFGTDEDGYSGLSVFGLASATMTYSSYDLDELTIDVQGFI